MLNEKKDYYRYSTKDVAAYYDLTAKGLAYYEKQGILSPARDEDSGYRVYSLDDCYSLYHSKLYANTGFTLKETGRLLQEEDTNKVLSKIEEEVEREKEALARRSILLERMQEIRIILAEYMKNGQQFSLVERPESYRLYVRNYDKKHTSSREQSDEFAAWNQIIPVDTASLKYDYKAVLAGEDDLNVDIGNIISVQDFERFDMHVSPRVEKLAPVKCVETIIAGKSGEIDQAGWLKSALTFMQQNRLSLCGDIMTKMLLVTGEKDNRMRYDLAWFPYK